MEILVIIVIVIVALVLAVAVGPLLAMRNPAEADKLTPGADPVHESRKEPDASESTSESPRPGTPRTSPSTRQGPDRNSPSSGLPAQALA